MSQRTPEAFKRKLARLSRSLMKLDMWHGRADVSTCAALLSQEIGSWSDPEAPMVTAVTVDTNDAVFQKIYGRLVEFIRFQRLPGGCPAAHLLICQDLENHLAAKFGPYLEKREEAQEAACV